MNIGRRTINSHNWGKAENTAGDGPGRRNNYLATPHGVVQNSEMGLGESGGPSTPRHQPFNPANIVMMDMGALLKESEDL